ncbi:MAG: glycosyltransferase family 39 protein [Candidatus Omnitrophica bacterium]|nr:glycosyltransferase family 39 protein [Candidatus Omnitrophota bacterium]
MIIFFGVLTAVFIPILIGWLSLSPFFLKRRMFFWEKVFVSYGLGFGILTLVMFYLSLLEIDFSPAVIVGGSLLVPMVILFFRSWLFPAKANGPSEYKPVASMYTWIEGLLVTFIIIAAGNMVFRTWTMAAEAWDSWAFWGFKAKIFFVEQKVPFAKFADFRNVWGNWDYPQHVPLMGTWIFTWLNTWNDQCSRIIYPLFHCGLAAGVYAFLRRRISRVLSLAAAFFILTLPGLVWTAVGTISEPVLLFYYVLSFVFLLEWEQKEGQGWFILSAIFAGFAVWTKNEGMVYALFNGLVILLTAKQKGFRQIIFDLIVYFLIIGAIIGPWLAQKNILGLENVLINRDILSRVGSVMDMAKRCRVGIDNIAYRIQLISYFNVTGMMFLFVSLINFSKCLRRPYFYFIVNVLCQMVLILVLTVVIPGDMFLYDASPRLLLTAAVIMLIYCAYISGTSAPDSPS